MALITELIPNQSFQIVQNRIAEILLEEITFQHNLQNLTSSFELFTERIEPYDTSEDVMISIAYREGEDELYDQRTSQATHIYFIDVFAGGLETLDQSMSENVRLKLFKYVGMIKYILNSAKYPTLSFPPGLIGNKHVKKITFDTDYSNWGNHSNYDASGIRFCRIIFSVMTKENTLGWVGVPLLGNDSIIYTGTNKGTQLTFNN